MDNLQIRQGETLTLNIESDDLTAQTVRIVVKKPNENAIIDEIANFSTVDGKRVAVLETTDTNKPVDTYQYMLTIEYADGTIKKLPDASNCDDGDCSLPELEICKALDLEVS